MIPTLFVALVTLLIVCLVLLILADRRVTHAADWEAIDRWLLVGTYAAPSAILLTGAVIGVGLAWWIM